MRGDSHTRFNLPSLIYKANLYLHLNKKFAFAIKLKANEVFAALSLILFSCCTLIMMVCYLSIESTIYSISAFAQELNQIGIGENDTNENNSDANRSSNASIRDKVNDMQNNYKLLNASENEFTPNRLITLVTEDVEINIAPGERVKAWTFNGTVPGPTVRLTEGA